MLTLGTCATSWVSRSRLILKYYVCLFSWASVSAPSSISWCSEKLEQHCHCSVPFLLLPCSSGIHTFFMPFCSRSASRPPSCSCSPIESKDCSCTCLESSSEKKTTAYSGYCVNSSMFSWQESPIIIFLQSEDASYGLCFSTFLSPSLGLRATSARLSYPWMRSGSISYRCLNKFFAYTL